MTKIRVLIFLLTIVVVGLGGTFASFYARGYRFDTKKLRFVPNGLLVVKSDPDGALIYIDGELKTATNTTLSLNPGTYDIEIKKEGYFTWKKRMVVEKEIVTEASASLFKSTPSFMPATLFGATNSGISDDLTKIVYTVPPAPDTPPDKVGMWLIETLNLPIGFPRDPRKFADGDFSTATWQFSPDGRNILATLGKSAYLLDTGGVTSQAQRVNIAAQQDAIAAGWTKERTTKLIGLTQSLPDEMRDLLTRKSSGVVFSPDETKILYTASASGTLNDNLIKQLPSASTQKQERTIKTGQTYVYDIKEDRNFLVYDKDAPHAIHWFPTSRHLVLAEEGKITIMDYDGTNNLVIYSGPYVSPNAFPFINTSRLLILTNLGATSSLTNLYSLNLK